MKAKLNTSDGTHLADLEAKTVRGIRGKAERLLIKTQTRQTLNLHRFVLDFGDYTQGIQIRQNN